jgi:hypothetical protein
MQYFKIISSSAFVPQDFFSLFFVPILMVLHWDLEHSKFIKWPCIWRSNLVFPVDPQFSLIVRDTPLFSRVIRDTLLYPAGIFTLERRQMREAGENSSRRGSSPSNVSVSLHSQLNAHGT